MPGSKRSDEHLGNLGHLGDVGDFGDLTVLDVTGAAVPLSRTWSERTAVLAFVRQFG